ncbi:MAG: hypothetical protein A3E07_03675 [Candidatus Wildermuthbacteria bacterium RIFCSPHIGHO2_12_FULL_45_9]|uniref:Formate hydrogenlyase n=1 Tax=Candidatus Wildermuthbacteria bacterium RIFCSPHIGHO2_02_FULL_45_25 TaxID=1802450 RepID=A0A1G2R1X9_9BACT|nr:MAG: hypothetical protein A3C04_03460 [Candidatus Wildermuthbacteria bacterium RIFCSPHIGHO2_02_FULL_45_25]OHA72421.1 MAG: hypothetical protein A3E07_03675 [Candidatus Wildermuthbacteria bacterium RIFCSPHIGHO2_12_FULL_45_9]
MAYIILWIIQLLLIPLFSPLCVGIIRKIKARMQNRQGASIFQPYKDLWKLLHKDEVISQDASWVFRFAPFVVFGATLAAAAGIPTVTILMAQSFTSDIIVFIGVLAVGTFFLALAGMDTGSAFGGFGSSREMTISALAEGGLMFSLLALAFLAETTNLFGIAEAMASSVFALASLLPIGLAFGGFFIALLAETARFPFDNPATHLELTMIHEAMILEYSGKRLALMEWASANKLMIFMTLGASVFFPFGIDFSLSAVGITMGMLAWGVKIFVFCCAIAILESSMAKLRFFRLPDLLLISFILSVVAIGLIIA